MEDIPLRTCDFCGMPDAQPDPPGYRCDVCDNYWTAEDREEDDDNTIFS